MATTTERNLEGRIGAVTGASSGIGEAIAIELADRGAAVVVNARREERLDELVQTIRKRGGRAAAVPGDAASRAVIGAMLDEARQSFGAEADIVVANAGRGLAGSVVTSDDSQWEEMIRTNVLGCARLIRAAALRMAPEGKGAGALLDKARDIVVIGSNVGRHVSPYSSMYGSTKFAAMALAEGARRELGPKGVRVSLVEPGIVESEFQGVAGYDDSWRAQFFEKFGPVLAPADIARMITFIVSQPAHVHVNNTLIRPTRQDYP
ncbi:MAG: SDR family oxidoreductase [Phycisphaeraceae bacterium]|nr:MAG: SDR family oxidoreductase [Phycisphaeraceae bacterium]